MGFYKELDIEAQEDKERQLRQEQREEEAYQAEAGAYYWSCLQELAFERDQGAKP